MIEYLGYGFVQRAFIAGVLVAAACAVLGVFLVPRRLSLIGDGLSHVAFGGIALGLLFQLNPFLSALAFALLGSLAILRLRSRLHGDTAIGAISQASLGIGVFLITLLGARGDLMSYLFGSVLTISRTEVWLSLGIATLAIAFVAARFHELFALTLDEENARTYGLNPGLLNTSLIMLTALTVVAAMRVTGLLLASTLLIMPPAAALQLSGSFRQGVWLAAGIAVAIMVLGLVLSLALDTPPSGSIVLLNFAVLVGATIARRKQG